MSQEGKVLHLYVEVRSVAEDEGKVSGRGDNDTSHLMLQCPDVLPHTQRSSTHSSPNRSPAVSPVSRHHPGARNHSLPSSKSTRHSVSFHLQNPDATGSPTQYHRQDVLPDGFGQLLEVLAPGSVSSGRHGSLGRTFSLDVDPYQGKVLVSPSSGRMNVASPPTHNRRSYEVEGIEDEEGKTSVVSFGYIEKSNVHSMAGRRASACQNEYDSSFNKIEGQLPAHLRKRLSDPMWPNGHPPQGNPSHSHHYPSRNHSPRDLPSLQKATLDSVGRDATSRALEEFGSPDLRRRFAGFGTEGYSYSPTLPRQQQSSPRCRSWGGSPVLPRTARTLPPKTQLLELDRGICHSSMTGLPRSPASDQLCTQIGHPAHAKTSAPHSPSQQRPCVGGESPRLTNKFHPPLPAGRPTDIQHEVPGGFFPSVNPCKSSCQPGHRVSNGYHVNSTNSSRNVPDGPHYMNGDKFDSSRSTHYRRIGNEVSPTSGRRSISPSSNPELACKLAVEATRMSSLFADRRTPSPTSSHAESFRSESPKSVWSILRESQPYATLHGQSSPDPLQTGGRSYGCRTDRSTPQTKPGCISPLLSQRGVSGPASPALLAPLHRTDGSQSPVLDPRQQRSSASLETSTLHRHQLPQYTGDHKSPGEDRRQYLHLLDRSPRDCSGLSLRLTHHNAEASPVSWTSRQQEWREARQTQDGSHHRLHPSRLSAPRRPDDGSQDGGHGAVRTSEYQSPAVSRATDQREEVLDPSGGAGTSSQSSSGVTGSLDDPPTLDRHHSPSPETSSQSSHETEGSPRTQVGVCVC